jgi:hypothetical protein
MTRIETAYLSFVPMNSRVYPDAQVLGLIPGSVTNGTSNVRAALDFFLDNIFQLDLTSILSTNPPHHGIQAMYIDASAMNYGPLLITVTGNTVTQSIVVSPLTQGYYPLVCQAGSPLVFRFENDNNIALHPLPNAINAQFLTLPVVASVWAANSSTTQTSSVTGRTQNYLLGNFDQVNPQHFGDVNVVLDYTLPLVTNTILIAQPTMSYYVTSIQVSFDPTSGGGNNYLFLYDTAHGNFWGTRFCFPGVRPATATGIISASTPPNFYFRGLPGTAIGYRFFTALDGAFTLTMNYGLTAQA